MKKILIATTIALAATTASALEVGVVGTRDYSGAQDRNGAGVTLGHKVGAMSVTAGFERFTKGTNDQDRWSLVAGYDVAKLGPITVTPKVGGAYLNNQHGVDGYAMTAGVGASLAVAKNVSLTADFARQYGQERVKAFDGNRVTVGVKYSF